MKITAVSVHKVELPVGEGSYNWSNDNRVEVFDSTVVAVDTDAGLRGYGEFCPLGAAYLPAYAEGARTGISEIAPALIGQDPREPAAIAARMDRAMRGHPYVKSALDMACWDLLGKACDLPLVTLLGGRRGEDCVLYRAISQEAPEVMAERIGHYRAEGYRRFQLKVGGDPMVDIARIEATAARLEPGDVLLADANTGWTMHGAARVVDAVRELDVYIEQPCPSYEECLTIRRRTPRPFVLDEVIDGVGPVLRGLADGAMDVVNLKISKVGGITRAREIRDLCERTGLSMIVEDTWGGDIVTAAIAHLAHSTDPRFLLAATDFNSYVTRRITANPPRRQNGRIRAPEAPGLGVEPLAEVLGRPVAVVR